MISFASDYLAGAHPRVLQRLIETNLENTTGYGTDGFCDSAKAKIKAACDCPEADVYFIVGGTQTNQLIISTMLDDNEGVLAATTGHVSGHEAGAIEYTGHKVLTLPQREGKICAADIRQWCETFYADANHDHQVFPGMVCLSFPTEYGTIYSKAELTAIYEVCQAFDMSLFIDGARLAYGLCSPACDLTLPELAHLCDVFYIGGTKCGALCGEGVVFTHDNSPKHFLTKIKQHGALLAKGRLLGVQFDALFTDDLYMQIGRYAIEKAVRLEQIFAEKGYRFFLQTPTNQKFIVLENEKLLTLKKEADFGFWEKFDETHTVVRFATSWSTTDADLEKLESLL